MAESIIGAFLGLDESLLLSMRTQWLDCLTTIAAGHQSVSIAGRQYTRANLMEVKMIIAEINYALRGGTGNFSAGGSFSGGNSIPFPSFSAPTTFAS